MPEPMDARHFAGPHPTCRDFVAQLAMWKFTQRGEEHVHSVFRGPHGGTLRVLRSQLGRVDPALVAKAARLAGITPELFWAGPPDATAAPAAEITARRERAARDSIMSVVLAVHASVDRPLGFDQVVDLSGSRVSRAQVSAASAALCRDGQLERIRAGVYQWSAGERNAARQVPAARLPANEAHARQVTAAELFSQIFPAGVQMTGELFSDLEQWARLTSKLAASGGSAAA